MEQRRRIRDLSHAGNRWIVSLHATEAPRGLWRGRAVFFLDGPAPGMQLEDTLAFEALEFNELVTQAAALSVDEMRRRLARLLAPEAS